MSDARSGHWVAGQERNYRLGNAARVLERVVRTVSTKSCVCGNHSHIRSRTSL